MYIGEEKELVIHERVSKLGNTHTYERLKTVVIFRCDNCHNFFRRDRQKMNPKRLTNSVYHCCNNCDAKKFAQSKGVESRMVWDMPVSSLKTLDQL